MMKSKDGKMKIYEIDTKHLTENIAKGKTIIKLVSLQEAEKEIEKYKRLYNYTKKSFELYVEEKYNPMCIKFVEHIQEHLNRGDTGLKLYKLRDKPKTVGCTICGKTIYEIWNESQ